MITEKEIEKLLSVVFQHANKNDIPTTFFEVITMVAFQYFLEKEVDYAVIETGLGGRLDATNVIIPILSIITSISLEHQDILGGTLEKITFEKGGIIKPGVPVLSGPRVPQIPIKTIAKEKSSLTHQVTASFSNYHEENCAIAEKALHLLNIDPLHISQAMVESLPCRYEVLNYQNNTIILDVAHNPDGFIALFKRIKQDFSGAQLRVICGFSEGKDVQKCLDLIQKEASFVYLIEAAGTQLVNTLKQIAKRAIIIGSITETIDIALQSDDLILICGTFFIMSEARSAIADRPILHS